MLSKLQAAKAAGPERLAALLEACRLGDEDAVLFLLREGVYDAIRVKLVKDVTVDVTVPSPQPLAKKKSNRVMPIETEPTILLDLLTPAGVRALKDTIESGITLPLHTLLPSDALQWTAVHAGHIGLFLRLVQLGFDPNLRETPTGLRAVDAAFLAACKSGDITQVRALIAMGASVNAQTEYGYPGLHIAASGPQRLELIRLLLSSGADVHSLTGDRETLLHVACVAGGPDVAEFLLQDPDFDYLSRRCDGATPESLLKRGEGSVAKAKILKLLQERKRRDEIKSWNVRMMSMEDHAVKRVRRLLDEKEEAFRQMMHAKRTRIKVILLTKQIRDKTTFTRKHINEVIDLWSEAERKRMEAAIAVKRCVELADQARATTRAILASNAILKDQMDHTEQERDEIVDHTRIVAHDFREPVVTTPCHIL